MSLIKQLWLAIVFILVLATSGSFILSTLSSKNYLEQQLQMKNIDNATSLALSMSQMPKDAVTLDLLISAQFDAGHYRYIGLKDPNDQVIAERINNASSTQAPAWFVRLIPINAEIGIADIQDGWAQFGTLTVESDTNFAYDKLWDSTIKIALLALLIGLIACYVGRKILLKILSPLDDVVDQAKALGENRFISIHEPKTKEFKAVVNAMNSLSQRIKNNAMEESARLEALRYQSNFDHITGLMNHDYFANKVDASISHEEYFNEGVLIVARLSNLAEIDQHTGYQETNALLKRIGDALTNKCKNNPSLFAGRLSGTDFAIFSTQAMDGYTLASQIKNILENVSQIGALNGSFITVSTLVTKTDDAEKIFTLADHVIDEISIKNGSILHVINRSDIQRHQDESKIEWHRVLTAALKAKKIKLEHYPVINLNNEVIHHECPVRLQLDENGRWFSAGEFITWAIQLNLIGRVDELVLETALDLLANGAEPLGINLSSNAICNPQFIENIVKLVQTKQSLANRLYFEVPEQGAFDHLEAFRHFCQQLKPLGCKIGIEHVGTRIARLGELHDIGLDYIKIDVSIVKGIDTNEAHKTLLRGLCMIAHSIGIIAIAEGVQTENEISTLKQLGIDGLTGPGIKI